MEVFERSLIYFTQYNETCPICGKPILAPSITPDSFISFRCLECGGWLTAVTYTQSDGCAVSYLKQMIDPNDHDARKN